MPTTITTNTINNRSNIEASNSIETNNNNEEKEKM